MDRNERINNTVNSLQQMLGGFQQKIWTALPGIVDSYDSTKITAVVQPAIKGQLRDPEGKWTDVTMPLCLDCPVMFPWAGDYGLTLPVAKNDEGLLVFSSRCIDSWWQSGGVQTQAEYRMHDLSDGFFLPGIFSQPRKLTNVSATKPQFRTKDGLTYVELDNDLKRVNVVAPNGLWVNGIRVLVP